MNSEKNKQLEQDIVSNTPVTLWNDCLLRLILHFPFSILISLYPLTVILPNEEQSNLKFHWVILYSLLLLLLLTMKNEKNETDDRIWLNLAEDSIVTIYSTTSEK